MSNLNITYDLKLTHGNITILGNTANIALEYTRGVYSRHFQSGARVKGNY